MSQAKISLHKRVSSKFIITAITIAWMGMMAFAPFIHPIEGARTVWSEFLYYLGLFIPFILLIILFINQLGAINMPQWVNSRKLWLAMFYTALGLVLGFIIWTQILGHYVSIRGSAPSLGLGIVVAIYLMLKFQDIGTWQSAFLGLLGAAFFAGGLEIPYQILCYALIWGHWTSWQYQCKIIVEQLMLSVPFILALLLYKIKPTKWTIFALSAFIAIILVWVYYFDFWSIVVFVGPERIEKLNTPINWAAYEMNKLYCIAFACCILGLKRSPKLNAAYDWQGFSSWNLPRRWWKRTIAKRVWTLAGGLNKDTLDIGCGSSPIITHFKQVIGIDIDQSKIDFMRLKTGQNFILMNAEKLQFGDGNFDLVLCIEVIEHIENSDKVIAEIARVLRPKGRAIIATPDTSKFLWSGIIQPVYNLFGGYKRQHPMLLTKDNLIIIAQKHNLALLHYEYIAGCDLICIFSKE